MHFSSIVLRFFIIEIIHLTILQITSGTSFSFAGLTDDLLFKGDIIVRPTQRSGDSIIHRPWPGGIIYYQFENINGPSQTLIKSMMGNLYHSTNGCIEFVPRDNESDYLLIKDHEKKCAATIGNAGGDNNTMVLGPMCFHAAVILHELYHVIGFAHEHSRWDRDDNVDIVWRNILEDEKHNFDIISRDEMYDYGLEYDYESIVHYDQYAFSKNGRMTIMIDEDRPEMDEKYQKIIGRVKNLSLSNIRKIKSKYSCSYDTAEYVNRWKDDPKFHGDIIVRPKPSYSVNIIPEYWPGGIVYYQFENIDDANQTLIRSMMENIYNSTNGCIEFIPRGNESNYLLIKDHEQKCASSIGYVEGDNNIMLMGPMCFSDAVILHELYHVIGFPDEHSRDIRVGDITINWENILEDEVDNFVILWEFATHGIDYDYESIVHYSQFAFSKNGKKTITTNNEEYQNIIGKAETLSPLNIFTIKYFYNC